MESMFYHILPLFVLSVVTVGCHAGNNCPMQYWTKMFPNNAMPKALENAITSQGQISTVHRSLDRTADLNAVTSLYFRINDLRPGKKMTVQFAAADSKPQSSFLACRAADSIFTSNSLPEVFKKLSVDPNSNEAEKVRNMVKSCEQSVNSKRHACLTSLESLVDLAVSRLGKFAQVISTEADDAQRRKEYSIAAVDELPRREGVMACHQQEYGLFHCHNAKATKVSKVRLVADDGSEAVTAATCHMSTAGWNPNDFALRVLKMKPGEGPACHFLKMRDVVWVA